MIALTPGSGPSVHVVGADVGVDRTRVAWLPRRMTTTSSKQQRARPARARRSHSCIQPALRTN